MVKQTELEKFNSTMWTVSKTLMLVVLTSGLIAFTIGFFQGLFSTI
jgi:hypothetical protein